MKPKAPFAKCDECPLVSRPCARSLIPKNPVAAVVARSPGWKEAQTGEPFTGLSGKVLNHLLQEQGIKREEVLLTNVVLCSPPEGDVPGEAIKACAPRLQAELDASGVDLVIAAGREAVNLLIGRGAIDRHRGYRIQQNGRTLVATNNPALVLRDDSTFPNLQKDFRRAFNPTPEPTLPTVEVIEDAKSARAYIEFLSKQARRYIAADIESRGGLTHKATLVTLQFSLDGRSACVLGEREGLWNDKAFMDNCLRPFLESKDHSFIFHNGKFDVKILRHSYGIAARVDEDSMLMSYACDERSGSSEKQHGGYHKLEYLLAEEFGWPNYESKATKETKKTGIVTDYNEFYTYAGRDAGGTYQLFELLSERIRSEEAERPYRELLLEGSEACSRIEVAGFRYDVDAAADLMENEVQPELERKTKNMRAIIEDPLLNPRSPKQISNIFYNRWGLRHEMQSRPNMAESTDDATLNELTAGRFKSRTNTDPTTVKTFAKELKRFRELSKQADTYIVALIERAINDPEHRLYTDLLLHGTTSGRLSSRNPNLQNITRTKEGLPDIRRLFLPSPGRVICQADYSQAELRCIAQFSGDSELNRIYREDLDLHAVAAANFYGEGFTSEQRSKAKCFHPKTQALTRSGWKHIGELECGEEVVQAIPSSGGKVTLEWAIPTALTKREEVFKLKSLQNEGLSLRVTEDHRMLRWTTEKGEPSVTIPDEMPKARRWANSGRMFLGDEEPNESLLRLAVAVQADGSYTPYGAVRFGFTKARKIQRCQELLKEANIPAFKSVSSQGATTFYIKAADSAPIRGLLTPNKLLPWWWLNLSTQCREWVLDEAQYWDAIKQPRWTMYVYLSAQRQNIDVMQAIAAITNRKTRIGTYGAIEGLSIKKGNTSRGGNLEVKEISHTGEVVCLSVPSSFVLVRDGGITAIVGQCMNFGVAYGQGAATFQEKHEIPEREAQKFIDWWWRYFGGVAEWKNEIIREMKSGHITSPFGRRRRFYLITPENKNAMIREAVNFKPQSTAGDFTLRSVILLAKEIDWKKAAIVITVHDNVVSDVRENYIDEYVVLCRQIMESRPKEELGWSIPFKVDIGIGPSWGEAK